MAFVVWVFNDDLSPKKMWIYEVLTTSKKLMHIKGWFQSWLNIWSTEPWLFEFVVWILTLCIYDLRFESWVVPSLNLNLYGLKIMTVSMLSIGWIRNDDLRVLTKCEFMKRVLILHHNWWFKSCNKCEFMGWIFTKSELKS